MRAKLRTYTAYSIGCAIVWAIALLVVATAGSAGRRDHVLLVYGGWVIGWFSATFARAVYPPPRSRSASTG